MLYLLIMKTKILFLLIVIAGIAKQSFSQNGNYFIDNYTPAMYGAGEQNWNILQDSLGRLFVANNDALMMYDGKYWKIIGVERVV